MDDRQAVGQRLDRRGQRQGEEVGADREQQVVARQRLADGGAEPGQDTAEERMRGGKRGSAGDRLAIDRRAEQLGERSQLVMGPAVRHRVAGDDHRPAGAGEQGGGGLYRGRVAAQPGRDPGRRSEVERRFVL